MTEVELIELEPERVKLKIGTFEADLSAACIGRVEVDGKPLVARKFVVICEVGKLAKIEVELIPVDLRGRKTAVGDQFESGVP